MPLPIPGAMRKALAPKDPADPIGAEEDPDAAEADAKAGKPNPLKKWANSKIGQKPPSVPSQPVNPVPLEQR